MAQIGVGCLLGFVVQEAVVEWMLVIGVHDLTCDGAGWLDLDVGTVQ